jgi:hypothetical protein
LLPDDLLRGLLELLAGEPTPMRQRPMIASDVNPAVTQQEGQQLLRAGWGTERGAV